MGVCGESSVLVVLVYSVGLSEIESGGAAVGLEGPRAELRDRDGGVSEAILLRNTHEFTGAAVGAPDEGIPDHCELIEVCAHAGFLDAFSHEIPPWNSRLYAHPPRYAYGLVRQPFLFHSGSCLIVSKCALSGCLIRATVIRSIRTPCDPFIKITLASVTYCEAASAASYEFENQ